MSKVVVIGIDGGTLDLMGPWIDSGQMPVLAGLINDGVSGYLETTHPPLTCPAWWSFSTGKNPGRFGSYHFWQLASKSYEIRRSKSFGPGKNLELWDILNSADLRCGIVNNPIMYPPAKIRDYSVAGCFASPTDFTYPPEFKKVIDEVAGGYELDSVTGESKTDEETSESCLRVLEKRRKVICHLLEAEDRPEFFLGVITESDRMCHRFLNRVGKEDAAADSAEAALLHFFKEMDSAIGAMIERVDDSDYIIIMSDHGFGNRDRGFYINEWLRQEGYLSIKSGSMRGSITGTARRQASNILSRLGLTDFIKARVPRSLLTRLAPVGEVEGEGSSIFDYIQNGIIDWGKTKAVALPDGLIYINTDDRPDGIIAQGNEYEALVSELKSKLEGLRDSSGKALDVQVFKREEVYEGEFLAAAPDLYMVIENYSVAAFPNMRKSRELFGSLALAGHRLNGMLIVRGPQIKKGAHIDSAKLLDLAPTILHIMGVPVPEDMDGRVLSDLFEPESELAKTSGSFQKAQYRDEAAGTEESAEEEEEIRKRLEELGYL